jgi:phosphinothricin acetyltransferase
VPLEVRPATPGDLNRLVEIYNHYVVETHFTFDTEPFAVGARTQWFTQFAETGPYRLLAGVFDDAVIGYASSTRFKPRPAYNTSVETTIYLDPRQTGKGFGRALYAELLRQLENDESVHRAYGGIAQPNPESKALHESLGFVRVGSYHEVGFKFGKYWDVDWYEKDMEKQ